MKSYLTALLLLALSACGTSESPHSDYFVVSFEPARSELPASGRAALSYATRDADRGTPREVTIKTYSPAVGDGQDLSAQRMKVIADALVEGGVPRNIIRLAPQPAAPDEFARLGNGVVVQIERGEPIAPAQPEQASGE